MWDAEQYLKYSEERSRPFFDLLARVRLETAEFIADLGCGPGTLTRTLAERWPSAQVFGVDNSPAMLAEAGRSAMSSRLEVVRADLAVWSPGQPLDLIVSNAALQWVGDHERLLARLARMLAPGGTLAVQVPYHFDEPAHRVIEETAAKPRWKDVLQGVGLHRKSVLPLPSYIEELHDLGLVVDGWKTTYMHVLTGENPVLEWFKGTALRPLLDRLSPPDQDEFLVEVGSLLQASYPPRGGITLLPFTRLFFVAVKP